MRNLLLPLLLFFSLLLRAQDTPPQPPASPDAAARLSAIDHRLKRIEQLLSVSNSPSMNAALAAGRIQVAVLGEVNVPGIYIVDVDAPIGMLVATAGGYTHTANAKAISVSTASKTTLTINARTDPRAYLLKNGDIVTVPEGYF